MLDLGASNPSPHASAPEASFGGKMFGKVSRLVIRAGQKTFWPLADQAVVSIGNFLTLVLVARALPDKAEYGMFGLLLEVIFYLNTIQSALVIYPLTVKGAISDDDRLRRITTASLLMSCLIALPVALLGLGVASVTQKMMLGLAGVFAMVAWQIQEVVRRALMAHFRYYEAAWGDALRYLGTAACVVAMWRTNELTLTSVFFIIGLMSALTVILQAVQVGPRWIGLHEMRELFAEFWQAGRWMLFTSLSAVLISICGVWTISYFHGNAEVGEFYAIGNFTKPVNPLMATFSGLVVQYSAKAFAAGGVPAARRAAMRLSLIACVLIIPYLVAVICFPGTALDLFYGKFSHFHDGAGQGELALRIFAFSFIVLLFMTMIGSYLNGIHRTRDNFYAQIVNSIVTVVVMFPLTIYYGLLGQMIGGTIAASMQFAAMVYYARRVPHTLPPST